MATAFKLSRVQKKGQVTIPVEIRQKLGLEEGDLVAFVETEQGFVIRPQLVVSMDTVDKIKTSMHREDETLPESFGFLERLESTMQKSAEPLDPAKLTQIIEQTAGAFPITDGPVDTKEWRRIFEEEMVTDVLSEMKNEE
jgi:AbrB family looped-hinge helix DNA binding protein